MAKTINLLPKIAEEELKKGVYRRRLSIFSSVILIVVLVLVIGIFAFRTYQVSLLNNLKKSSSAKESSILSDQFKEVILRTLNLKLNKIAAVLKTSPKYSEYISDLSSLGGGVLITDIKIEGKTIDFSIFSPNSDSLATFVNNLINSEIGGKKFKNVNLSSFSYSSKDSAYKASLKMESIK